MGYGRRFGVKSVELSITRRCRERAQTNGTQQEDDTMVPMKGTRHIFKQLTSTFNHWLNLKHDGLQRSFSFAGRRNIASERKAL